MLELLYCIPVPTTITYIIIKSRATFYLLEVFPFPSSKIEPIVISYTTVKIKAIPGPRGGYFYKHLIIINPFQNTGSALDTGTSTCIIVIKFQIHRHF